MRTLPYAIAAASLAMCAGCAQAPSNICELPSNRHFWQGMDVSWRGEVIDIAAPPHGGIIAFFDPNCGISVPLDDRVVPNLYANAQDYSGHAAVTQVEARGRLIYKDGQVVLRPTLLKRTSQWITGDAFDAHMTRLYSRLHSKSAN